MWEIKLHHVTALSIFHALENKNSIQYLQGKLRWVDLPLLPLGRRIRWWWWVWPYRKRAQCWTCRSRSVGHFWTVASGWFVPCRWLCCCSSYTPHYPQDIAMSYRPHLWIQVTIHAFILHVDWLTDWLYSVIRHIGNISAI